MFACCCPPDRQQPQRQIKHLKQKLIPTQQHHFNINSHQLDTNLQLKPKQPIKPQQQKQIHKNQKIERMASLDIPSSNQSRNQILPPTPFLVTSKSLLKQSFGKLFEQNDKIRKKSDLWLQQASTKIVYLCTTKQQEMVFSYRISHIYHQQTNPLNYLMNSKSKYKSKDILTCLALFNKTQTQLRSYLKSLDLQHKTKIIFSIIKSEEQLKNKFYAQKNDINQIILMNNLSLRLEIFNVIIIYCLNQKSFQQILIYCDKLTHKYELEELEKVIFILPPETTLQQIQILLTRLLRRFLISQKLQKILKYLGYHIQLLKNQENEYIIIRNSILMSQAQQRISKQFQIKLQLVIGLLMIEIKQNNFEVYEKMMSNLFVDMTINNYLKTVLFVHKDEKSMIHNLQELNMVQHKHLMDIQNSVRIQQRKISPHQKCIIIRHKIKKRMAQFFKEYKQSQTPIQNNKKQKQWDDQLKIHDIKATAMHQTPHQTTIEEPYNIFEVISQVELNDSPFEIVQDPQIRYE